MAPLKVRRCSYCALPGHDRRKCIELRDDKIGIVSTNRKWIHQIVRDMEANGVGEGTILKMNPRAFDETGRFAIAMVTGFNWHNLFVAYPTRSWIRVKYFAGNEEGLYGSKPWYNFGTSGHFSFKDCHQPKYFPKSMVKHAQLAEDVDISKSLLHSKTAQVISPAQNCDLKALMPVGVAIGGHGVNDWFDNKRSKDYYHNKAASDGDNTTTRRKK